MGQPADQENIFFCVGGISVRTSPQRVGWGGGGVHLFWGCTFGGVYVPCIYPCSGELSTQKLKSHLLRTQSLKVLPLNPGVGQYMTMYATFTARDFFLTNFYPSGPFTCIFFKNLSRVCPVLVVADTGSCVGTRNKIGHPAGCRFPCSEPAEY